MRSTFANGPYKHASQAHVQHSLAWMQQRERRCAGRGHSCWALLAEVPKLTFAICKIVSIGAAAAAAAAAAATAAATSAQADAPLPVPSTCGQVGSQQRQLPRLCKQVHPALPGRRTPPQQAPAHGRSQGKGPRAQQPRDVRLDCLRGDSVRSLVRSVMDVARAKDPQLSSNAMHAQTACAAAACVVRCPRAAAQQGYMQGAHGQSMDSVPFDV